MPTLLPLIQYLFLILLRFGRYIIRICCLARISDDYLNENE